MQYRNHLFFPFKFVCVGLGGGGGGGGRYRAYIVLAIHSSCYVIAYFNSKLRDLLGMKSTPGFLANPVLL